MRFFDSRAKQSFPMFWIFGSLGGLGFVFMGGLLIYGYLSLNSQERDGGMLGAGIVFLIMGLFLLAGVVYTLIKIYKPNDENVKTDKNHSQEGIIK